MKFTSLPLQGGFVIEPKSFGDKRGFFAETYRKDLFRDHGIDRDFVQDNHSASTRGTLRGLHYQIAPDEQAKLIRVIQGEIFDVVVDIRETSSTYGQVHAEILSSENRKMLYIPEGFAHGFLVISKTAEVVYKTSNYYAPQSEHGIIWNDPTLAIEWPKLETEYLLSEKDQKYPYISAVKT